MDILEIKTSKNGLIWPTGYWKTLIDSIFRNGSRNNPLCTYCDFKKYLEGKVIVSSSRYFFPLTKTFSSNDDSILKAISVEKVKPGLEKVQLKQEHHIVPNFDSNIEFEYFGTIGNKTYESQSKRNRENLSNKFNQLN